MKHFIFSLFMALLCQAAFAEKNNDVYITKFKDDKKAAISFTFDDGMLCHYTDIAPQLEKRGFRGTFWIIGENMDKVEPSYPWMTWKQVSELSARGHEMSNHTWTHPDMTKLKKDDMLKEILKCDSALEAATGKRPITFCYPYNAMNDIVVKAASANRVGSRTFQDAQGQDVSKCTKESLSAWLKETINQEKWSVTMTHGTTYGYDKWENPELLYELFDEVKEHENEVWVATFAEVAAYTQEREHTHIRVRRWSSERWSIHTRLSLDERVFAEKLTLRINGNWEGKDVEARQGHNHLTVINNGDHILVEFNPSGRIVKIKTNK